jgi:hypothetical protein
MALLYRVSVKPGSISKIHNFVIKWNFQVRHAANKKGK